MKALIDGDIICYEFGSCTDDEFKPLKWPLVASRVLDRINGILRACEADEHKVFLTGPGNFRIAAATIKPYKGHRLQEKPFHWERIRKYLLSSFNAEEALGIEADDLLSLNQTESTVICTKDKDLHMIPGFHYSWHKPEKGVWYQDETEGLRCFYRQLLKGDPTDNIPGLYGVGDKSALVSSLDKLSEEQAMYNHVRAEYEKRFGRYWRLFLEENARLLWILRTPDDEEVISRIERLEKVRRDAEA